MNTKSLFIIILLFLLPLSRTICEESPPPKVGDDAPTFSLLSLDGDRIYLRDYCGEKIRQAWRNQGKFPVVLSFFSTTCKPCVEEIGQLHNLADKFRERAKFFLIAVGEPAQKVRTFVKKRNYSIPVLIDQYLVVSEKYGDPQQVPKLVLMDAEGVIRLFKIGYEEETMIRLELILYEITSSP